MTITLTAIAHGDLCHGARWTVDDVDVLAARVARVALGQYRHVAQILEGLDVSPPATPQDYANDAKRKLRVAANGDPWHRDGWLFQVMSWITANQSKVAGAVLNTPHIYHAHKGFDGLQLQIGNDGRSIEAVVIFEDKATTDPRGTLRDDVWPAIAAFEDGQRVTELSHEATALLAAQQQTFPEIDVDEAIDQIVWLEARRYRVSITTGATHSADANRQKLFSGYDGHVTGGAERRRAETMHFDNLREWMTDFAARVEAKIDEAVNV